jgi:hypothetical protein
LIIWLFFIIENLYFGGDGIKPIGPSNIKEILQLKDLLYYFSFAKSFLYLLSAILTILQRRRLMRALQNSPLLEIDDTLTEEIYRNIIQQSKNPDNPILLEEYKKLVDDRRKLTLMRTTNSQESSSLNLTKNLESINNNKDTDLVVRKS